MPPEISDLDIVTGAFSFTGKYIAEKLIKQGRRVRTLTWHVDKPNPFSEKLEAYPYRFDKPGEMAMRMAGAATLYNTYWIRFERGKMTYKQAVDNTRILLRAAKDAGVRRVVHLSAANANEHNPYPYFMAKYEAEKVVTECGIPYAVLRPTLIFGLEDIVFNNLTHLLRTKPYFVIPGTGHYSLQPVYAGDVADQAILAGNKPQKIMIDVRGPETFTYLDLVDIISKKVYSRARILHLPRSLVRLGVRFFEFVAGDALITTDEMNALMEGMLMSGDAPNGGTRFTDWLDSNGDELGRGFMSEKKMHPAG